MYILIIIMQSLDLRASQINFFLVLQLSQATYGNNRHWFIYTDIERTTVMLSLFEAHTGVTRVPDGVELKFKWTFPPSHQSANENVLFFLFVF